MMHTASFRFFSFSAVYGVFIVARNTPSDRSRAGDVRAIEIIIGGADTMGNKPAQIPRPLCGGVGFIFALFVCLLFPQNAFALTISPLRQTVVVDQGATERVRVEIINDTGESVLVVPEVDAFRLDTMGRPVFGAQDAALRWVRSDTKEIRLRPKETGSFAFIIALPKNAEPGGHYLGLFATQKPPAGGVGIGSRVGSLLFLYVSGELTEELQKVEFAPLRQWFAVAPVTIRLGLANTGKIHVVPQGFVAIRNGRGEVVGQFFVNEDRRKILPASRWETSFSVPHLAWGDIGRLTALVNVQYGAGNQHLFDAVTFWYLPWEAVIPAGAAIVAVCILLLVIASRAKKKRR